MKNSWMMSGFIGVCVVLAAVFAGTSSVAAETHVIEAVPLANWKLGNSQSAGVDVPLNVDVKKGDIVEIKVAGGNHGFVTLDGKGNDDPSLAVELVWACGESQPDKAVLREIDCGDSSNFNKLFIGTLRLEVLDKFKDDTNFWCVEHVKNMWGTLKLKS